MFRLLTPITRSWYSCNYSCTSSWWWMSTPETCRAYSLTAWRRVLLEKLTGLQLVKKFPAFHGTRRFITALTSARHLSLSWPSSIQSIYPHPTSWRSILMLSTHLRLGLPGDLLPSGFPSSRAAYRNSINWIQSHLVGQLLKLIHDARTHEYKKLPLSLSVRIWGGCWFSSQYGI